MALVREHSGYVGFVDGYGSDAFDALGYAHDDAMLGFDAASLFAGAGSHAGAGEGYMADGGSVVWPGAARVSSSVLAFDRATSAAMVSGEEGDDEERDAWIDAVNQSYAGDDAAARHATTTTTVSVGFDANTGCFTLTERAASSGGAGRSPFGLLFPTSTAAAAAATSPERASPARASQKRTYVGVEPPASVSPKKHCGAGRKAISKAKSAPAIPTKDPQSLAAKVTSVTKIGTLRVSSEAIEFSCLHCCCGDLSRGRSCCRIGGNGSARGSGRCRSWCPTAPRSTWSPCSRRQSATSSSSSCKSRYQLHACLVLATDEFWPEQGGKAPEISQVREALDAILSAAAQRGQLN
ncbi:hypothetical protein HU200_017648 [Digitaria exilis]|uniref:Uncharacterized protein n=1 Tax=Digitaria exilis TaxID=1010633 RepID=A0A835F6D8_9POAL|nr:hypothetical protein HU200_017648 [Digitaria exilis]